MLRRRFELLKPENEKALLALLEAKELSREDIILILQTLSLTDYSGRETALQRSLSATGGGGTDAAR